MRKIVTSQRYRGHVNRVRDYVKSDPLGMTSDDSPYPAMTGVLDAQIQEALFNLKWAIDNRLSTIKAKIEEAKGDDPTATYYALNEAGYDLEALEKDLLGIYNKFEDSYPDPTPDEPTA